MIVRRVVLIGSLFVALGCGSGRRTHARVQQPGPLHGQLRQGEIAFMRHCNHCHPGGAGGLGPSLNEKPLPRAAIALQVRRGLGAMPAFGESVIDEPTLDALTKYLDWLSDLEPSKPS